MADANPTLKPYFQIEGGVYTYNKYNKSWWFRLPDNSIYEACIPNNPTWRLRHLFAYLNLSAKYTHRNYLLRHIRKSKGRKQ